MALKLIPLLVLFFVGCNASVSHGFPNPLEIQGHMPIWIPLFLGLLVLGFLTLLVTLIVNRKTRPIGLGVAGVLAVVVIIPIGAYLLLATQPRRVVRQAQVQFERSHQHAARPHESIVLAPAIAEAEATIGTCSMHPQIRQPRPGKCPICGMSLVPVSTAAGGDSSNDKSTTTPETDEPARAKPDWVKSPPKRVGDSYRRVIKSDPFATVEECHKQLDELMSATDYESYIQNEECQH